MTDDSQIVVPPSFIALYLAPGRSKPNASRDAIAARHEFCEDLASMLSEHAAARLWELGISETDVLERVHSGLISGDAGVTAPEAQWVLRRLAEMLDWQPLVPADP